jgi:hypothetical protein
MLKNIKPELLTYYFKIKRKIINRSFVKEKKTV